MISRINLRPAFSMITAIFVIIMMATVALIIMNLSGKVVAETTAQYRKEQAILYSKSYTEFAIMALTTQNCVQTITANVDGTAAEVINGQGYRVIVNIQYLGNNNGCTNTLGNAVTTDSSQGNVVLIDTYVRYREPSHDHATGNLTWVADRPGITYHRRTIQKL